VMKRHRKEVPFIKQIETIPNISLACEKVGIARNTVYRWCNEDADFKDRLNGALDSGKNSVNDLAESKLISQINSGNMQAIRYWLTHNKKNYRNQHGHGLFERVDEDNRVTKIVITKVDPDNPKGK